MCVYWTKFFSFPGGSLLSLLYGNDFMCSSPFNIRTLDKSLPCYLVGALIFAACTAWGLPSIEIMSVCMGDRGYGRN